MALARNYVFVGAPLDGNHGNVFKCSFDADDLNQQTPNTCSKVDGKFVVREICLFLNPYLEF